MNVVILGFIFTCLFSAPRAHFDSDDDVPPVKAAISYEETLAEINKLIKSWMPARGSAIECFRCNSSNHRECLEKFIQPSTLKPESCSDVFEARYCIKTTGYYQGEVGDQRFCSSRDLGNYCEYIQRNEDEKEFRSCVYTCSTDACNSANTVSSFSLAALISSLLVTALMCLRRL